MQNLGKAFTSGFIYNAGFFSSKRDVVSCFFYTSSPVKQCRHLQLLAHNIFTIAHNPPSGGATQRHRLELNVLVHLFTLHFLFSLSLFRKWDFVMATLKDEGVVSTANASRAVKTPNGRFRLFILWALAEKKTAELVMSFPPPPPPCTRHNPREH